MNARLSIGFVARQTGCPVPTIRYYEEIGLLPTVCRTEAGQRLFDEKTIRRLAFIRRCRDFGFSIDQVRELVGLVEEPDRSCVEVRDIAATHLVEIRRKLNELKALEASISAFVCSCEMACVGGPAVDCTILEDLAASAEKTQGLDHGGMGCCAK